MIKKYSLTALQQAINHALSLDESTPTKIEALHGKVLQLVITPLNVQFFIHFTQHQLQLHAEFDSHPDTIIHSSPLGLIRLSLLPSSKVRSLFNDKIRITGDIELGQQVKKLFDELDIDWEGHLAHFTGDVVAHQIGSLVRHGLSWKRRLSQSLQHNITDYLQEELRLFPTKEEVDDFFNDIDDLSLDVERLATQINHQLAPHELR